MTAFYILQDGLNPQCFAATIFIYFASLSGAIAFGGLMGTKTNDDIGIPETLLGEASTTLKKKLLAKTIGKSWSPFRTLLAVYSLILGGMVGLHMYMYFNEL
jgi:hypothetical protein